MPWDQHGLLPPVLPAWSGGILVPTYPLGWWFPAFLEPIFSALQPCASGTSCRLGAEGWGQAGRMGTERKGQREPIQPVLSYMCKWKANLMAPAQESVHHQESPLGCGVAFPDPGSNIALKGWWAGHFYSACKQNLLLYTVCSLFSRDFLLTAHSILLFDGLSLN